MPRIWKEPVELQRGKADVVEAVYDDDQGTLESTLRRPVVEDQTFVEHEGKTRLSRVNRAVDILADWLANGTIDEVMLKAGRTFQDDFDRAHIGNVSASCWERVGRSSDGAAALVGSDSRAAVWDALKALGGHSSPAGLATWYCLGIRLSLAQFSLRMTLGPSRQISPHAARGLVVASLCALTSHYGYA